MSDSGITVPLYQAHIPIYPRSVKGRFRSFKWGILVLAYSVYFLLPWLRWERASAPAQAVLFDIDGRRFYLFNLVVHAQDIFWLAGLLVIAALLLFFVTGVAGRVFCGYFCFQTLWTDVYMLIERLVQGERLARMRLDKAPWGAQKIYKKGLTHLLWILVAFATGLAFTLYWADAPQLVREFFTGQAPFPAYATTLFLTSSTYIMAGLAREQVCTYMCPYARFQSAMFDRDTLIVAYDARRGEGGQGRHRPTAGFKTREERQRQSAGDCIDCGYCVQVCPTGIDIRDGLQIQCISCALCIDACDTIMDAQGWPRGLIKYTSERQQAGEKTRYLKLKTFGYGAGLTLAAALLIGSIATQAPLDASVSQVRQPLYVQLSDGRIQNSYEIKLNNKTEHALRVLLAVEGLPGAELDLGHLTEVVLQPEQRLQVLARVRAPAGGEAGREFHFIVTSVDGSEAAAVERPALFYVPSQRKG